MISHVASCRIPNCAWKTMPVQFEEADEQLTAHLSGFHTQNELAAMLVTLWQRTELPAIVRGDQCPSTRLLASTNGASFRNARTARRKRGRAGP